MLETAKHWRNFCTTPQDNSSNFYVKIELSMSHRPHGKQKDIHVRQVHSIVIAPYYNHHILHSCTVQYTTLNDTQWTHHEMHIHHTHLIFLITTYHYNINTINTYDTTITLPHWSCNIRHENAYTTVLYSIDIHRMNTSARWGIGVHRQ